MELSGIGAVVLFESPPVMADGGWKQAIVISDEASPEQQRAVEEILTGRGAVADLAGSWPTRADADGAGADRGGAGGKSVTIAGVLRGAIEAIRGRDRAEPVNFVNIYNQIHDSTQVIATGSSECDDAEFVFSNGGTHGLWSRFRWAP